MFAKTGTDGTVTVNLTKTYLTAPRAAAFMLTASKDALQQAQVYATKATSTNPAAPATVSVTTRGNIKVLGLNLLPDAPVASQDVVIMVFS